MKLYEIPAEYERTINEYYTLFDAETGELIATEEELAEVQKTLAELENRAGESLEYLAKKYASETAENEALKNEIERLENRQKQQEKKTENLKNFIEKIYFKFSGNQYQKTNIGNFTLSYRKSESVKILDETKIPKEFFKEKIQTAIDKAELKKALKEKEIAGAEIEEKQNFYIK